MATVLICDDSEVILDCLVSVLKPCPGIQVIGTARDGVEAVQKTRELCPDVVLIDAQMPNMDAVQATRTIKNELPSVGVLLLSFFTDHFEDAVTAGADGCIVKDCGPVALTTEVERIERKRRRPRTQRR